MRPKRIYRQLKNFGDKTMGNTNYENWQLEKYGNVIGTIESTPDGELYESGIEELNRLAEWMNEQAERQLDENQ